MHTDDELDCALPSGFDTPVPWDRLCALSTSCLIHPEHFANFKTLDPDVMSWYEVFQLLDILLEAQTQLDVLDVLPLQFELDALFLNHLAGDDDIEEVVSTEDDSLTLVEKAVTKDVPLPAADFSPFIHCDSDATSSVRVDPASVLTPMKHHPLSCPGLCMMPVLLTRAWTHHAP